MHVYLVRHTRPQNRSEPDAVLGKEGIAQAKMLGKLLATLQLQPGALKIISSPMQRARQTATYMCEEMGIANDVFIFPTPQEEHSGIPLEQLLMQHLRRIAEEEVCSNVIVVGHYPTLSPTFAWLAGQRNWPLPQHYGAVACLNCRSNFEETSGALQWLVTADLLLGVKAILEGDAPPSQE
jgi:phosphohistidine phosphatase SixA